MTILLWQKPLTQVVRQIVQRDNGAWFDPSDMSTLYQDAAGTTPVTAVEQPVGLVLDKSQGLMLGPELVVNGDFSNGTDGWTPKSALLSSSSGVLRITNTLTDFGYALQIINTIVGKTYMYKGAVLGGTGNTNLSVKIGPTNYSKAQFEYGIKFVATSTKTQIQLNVGVNTVGAYLEFTKASLVQLYGNHATQSVTASRPVLSARKNVLLATETLATQSVTSLAAKYCLSFWGTGSITLSGTSTGVLQGTSSDNRVWIEFTPTAGTLTLTVSGSVNKAQLELTS